MEGSRMASGRAWVGLFGETGERGEEDSHWSDHTGVEDSSVVVQAHWVRISEQFAHAMVCIAVLDDNGLVHNP
jgi:hypothetical protein